MITRVGEGKGRRVTRSGVGGIENSIYRVPERSLGLAMGWKTIKLLPDCHLFGRVNRRVVKKTG